MRIHKYINLIIYFTISLFILLNISNPSAILSREIHSLTGNYKQHINEPIISNNIITQNIKEKTQREEFPSQSKEEKQIGYPVIFNNETLFTISNTIGNVSAESRAERVSGLIAKFANTYSLETDAIEIIEVNPEVVLLSAENIPMLFLEEDDAKSMSVTLPELSSRYKQIIIDAVKQYREERSFKRRIINTGFAIGTTILFVLLLKLVFSSHLWLINKIKARERVFLRNIRLQRLQLLSVEQQKRVIFACLQLIVWLINIFLFFTYIGVVFRIFPATQKYGDELFSSFKVALSSIFSAILGYSPNLFIIAITLFIARYIIRFINFIFEALQNERISIPGFYQEWIEPTKNIVRFFIYAIVLVIIFPYLPGANSPAFQGISIFLGALFTFGGASAINNVIGGITVIYTRAYQIGDLVKVGDVMGTVLEKTIISTRLLTVDNQIVTIPNSIIVSSKIVNYTATNRELKTPLILSTTVTLGYDVPWQKVNQVLIDAALATKNISHEFKPFVLQSSLNDFSVAYELKAHTKLDLQASLIPFVYSELHQNIQNKCNEADIEILSPHYSAIRDGNHNTIPANYLPDDYQAPGFKIDT